MVFGSSRDGRNLLFFKWGSCRNKKAVGRDQLFSGAIPYRKFTFKFCLIGKYSIAIAVYPNQLPGPFINPTGWACLPSNPNNPPLVEIQTIPLLSSSVWCTSRLVRPFSSLICRDNSLYFCCGCADRYMEANRIRPSIFGSLYNRKRLFGK